MKKLFLVVFLIIVFIFIVDFFYGRTVKEAQNFKIGVSFSPDMAKSLGLDWKSVYSDILDNLKVKNLRLTSYWNTIQPQNTQNNFSDLDYQINEAGKRGVEILLVLGIKQPGWPECHTPDWAKNLTVKLRQQKSSEFIKEVVEKYKTNSSIKMWQIENEPLFPYGADCDSPDENFLKQEIALVKQLDPTRQIVVSDSGELSLWIGAMSASDVFGTTMYRTVQNPIFGNFTYPFSPYFYTLRSNLIRNLFAKQNQKTIITELQAEPWFSEPLTQIPIVTQAKTFSVQNLKENVQYAKKTGFDSAYLWGAEWWYFMDKNGYSVYLKEAKTLF